ncbi:hypothetical protein Poli38472_014100 [Pythium oligandrum]|uniref:ABC transporter domain-containing protein n=1 Tax=Pythium oligandrum TaxID=41045 RepID=A0A8K1CR16_PYTOL|nr:hypothetical protein Poli38472_014100 [Pythium oligandrum]|eukprot:TMW66788.1 hypothetical protein Poli38472_014100 [Pythium oligandrum]
MEEKAQIHYRSAEGLLAKGSHAFHEHVASRMEVAMGRALPQMEVRFKNLSLSADIQVAADEGKAELPTIPNFVKKRYGCAGKKSVVRKDILKNISGVFEPGTVTLVLGQPGSGKSSLMKVLSGRFPMEKNINLEGEIMYNGSAKHKLASRLPQFVSYVTQHDKHFPTLTVKETLEFAHKFSGSGLPKKTEQHFSQGTPEENRAAILATRTMYEHFPEIVLQQLGLQHCKDTVVGDAMLRGVSGGEKKRVTTGEMEFGNKYVTLMDEISTGLDSAATYDIISMQRSIAKQFQKTVVISLLQPSPEVFALFDNVMILNEGQVMYYGPCEEVQEYFTKLGFVCPPGRDLADFLVDLGTDQQRRYEVETPGVRVPPRRPSEFAELFERSVVHDRMLEKLHGPHDPQLLEDVDKHFGHVPEFQQSFWDSTLTLMRRQFLVTMRNKAFLKGKLVLVIIMALLYGSAFYQFDFKEIQVAMGVIFFAVLYLALGQTPMLPLYFEAREIFYKQRRANFYRTSSYVLSWSASQIPLTLGEAIVFGSIVYWMCGFVATAEQFLLFEALLFLTNLAFAAFFFFISTFTSGVHTAKPLSLSALLICILFSGFVLPRNKIPDYFIWLYWMDPISWGVRSLAVSQYRSAEFDVAVYEGVNYMKTHNRTMGEFYLEYFDIQTDKIWIVYGVLFNIVVYIVCMLLSMRVLENKRMDGVDNIVITKKDKGDDYALLTTPKEGAKNGHGGDTAINVARQDRVIKPVTVAFQDLWYTVPVPGQKKEKIDLLKGISGYALPGKMTALMGSSGAGKTTLMDVIAKRKTGGKTRGKILLNGHEATDLAIRRATGYCEQMDIHADSATVREALTFSAFMRQGSDVPAAKKYDSVQECLELLDLTPIADHIVRSCTVEQLKRLTIGVELAAQPSVLFLDEPTSGLDARSAKVIMDGVRKVADTGRTILCTIHQPSTEVFMLFDSLLLLKRGGETVYFGDLGQNGSTLINYFEGLPGVPRIEEGYNPANWMLDVIGAGVDNTDYQPTADFVAEFNASPLRTDLERNLNREGIALPSPLGPLKFNSKRAAGSFTQMTMLVQRFMRMYWRTPEYNWTRIAVHIFLGVLFGGVFFDSKFDTYQGINGGLGMVFMSTAFLGIVALNSMVPIASEARSAFYRERASQTYNAFWYFIGFTLAEIPYVVVASAIYTAIFFPMAGFSGIDSALLFWGFTVLNTLTQIYLGQFLSFALPSVEVAALIGVLLNSIAVLFMGFNPPATSVPSGYRWLFDIIPQRYSFMLLSAMLFGQCDNKGDNGCIVVDKVPNFPGKVTVKDYLDLVFSIRHDDMYYYLYISIIILVVLRVLALLALRFLNHQKK